MHYSTSRWSQLSKRAKQCQGCDILAEVHRRRVGFVRPKSVVIKMEMKPEQDAQFGSASGVFPDWSSEERNSRNERGKSKILSTRVGKKCPS
jgi:hypothetical protein